MVTQISDTQIYNNPGHNMVQLKNLIDKIKAKISETHPLDVNPLIDQCKQVADIGMAQL